MSSADPKTPKSCAVVQSSGDRKPETGHEQGADRPWRVSDDLPCPTPVGRAEIEALEIYLGAQIDEILRRMRR